MNAFKKLILGLNLIVCRLDAFLYNFFDSLLILGYSMIIIIFELLQDYAFRPFLLDFSKYFYYLIINLIIVPIILHAFYMVVYIINDAIDSKTGTKKNVDPSFYLLRPIYYFKSSGIIVYMIFLYLSYFIFISFVVFPNIAVLAIFFVIIISVLGFLHSIVEKSRRVLTNMLLRLVKYSFLVTIFSFIVFEQYLLTSQFWIFVSLIFPHTIYISKGYLKDHKLKPKRLLLWIAPLPFLASIIGTTIISSLPLLFIKATFFGYFLIVIPAFCISKVSLLVLERHLKNANGINSYYIHLFHLLFAVILLLAEMAIVLSFLGESIKYYFKA